MKYEVYHLIKELNSFVLLEINLTEETDKWLKLGDKIRLEIEELGILENKINLEK